jgi:hypothetical protein
MEWFDNDTVLLLESDIKRPEFNMWRFDCDKRQIELLDEDAKKSLIAISLEKRQREEFIQSLGGRYPDWWFEK